MQKEIEKYFVKRLQTYLLEYLNDFSQNNVAKFNLGISTNIRLENLSIKKQALLNFSLPMYIIDGKISSITLNMPLNYKSQLSEMIIEGIDLTICAISETSVLGWNKDRNIQGDENLKKHKLKIWEEQMSKYFEQLCPPNWIQKIVDGIYNNMSITIKSFNIKFQNNSIFGYETILRIKADIFIKATDNQFKQKFNSDLKSTYRQIEIKKLSVSLRGSNFKFPQNKKDDSYILQPIDITAKLTINKDNDQLASPLQILSIKIDQPIIFQLNKDQKNYILKLNELIKNLEIIQDNYHLRPQCEVRANFGEWWKYLINAVIQNQKNHKLDLGYSSRRLVLMKRYIELYKRKQNIILVPWLSTWTLQDEQKYQKCEKLLSLKDLLKYREWAFQEIRIEAKRYYHSSKDGQHKQSVKPILEIWTNTINNQNSFKDHQKNSDDDMPIELEDDEKINLYEILERDKTQVLSNFLKGINNDPDQIKLHFQLEIHSIFIILVEHKMQSQIIYTPNNTQIFKNCQCSKCISSKLIKRQNSESARKSRKFQSNSSQFLNLMNEQIQQNKDEASFHTAKAMDSFLSDLNDLQEDKQIIQESVEHEPEKKGQQQKQPIEAQKGSKVFLLISMLGIGCEIQIYQNGKIITSKQNPIFIADIKIISLGMIPTLMKEKINDRSNINLLPQDEAQNMNSVKRKISDFLFEIFEITIQKDQAFLNSEACFLNFIEFLGQNDMGNIGAFLTDYERDKNCLQDFVHKNFEQYDNYFDEDTEDFIHLTIDSENRGIWEKLQHTIKANKEQANKSKRLWQSSENKQQYIQQLHSRIVEIIKKQLFIPFLEDYGDQILHLCIMNLKDKLQVHQYGPIIQKYSSFKLSMFQEGEKSEYQIKPIEDKQKKQSKQKENDVPQFEYMIDIQPFQTLLTTKSIAQLLDFLEPLNSNSLSSNQLFVTENHQLLECILKSKPLSQEQPLNTKPSFQVNIHEKLKIRILSDQIANITRTELKFQIEQSSLETVGIARLLEQMRFTESLSKNHKYYTGLLIKVKKFLIMHKFYGPDRLNEKIEQSFISENQKNDQRQDTKHNSKDSNLNQQQQQQQQQQQYQSQRQYLSQQQKQQQQQYLSQQQQFQQQQKIENETKRTILSTTVVIIKLDSKIENHVLLTQSKLYIQIPYLKIEITDQLICLAELLTILKKKGEQVQQKQQNQFIMSQDSLLRAELVTLYKDHNHDECKHCILKYKKSTAITNILIGLKPAADVLEAAQQATWFNVLDSYITKSPENIGFQINFLCMNRFGLFSQNQTVLWIPVVIITRDQGYFKDLITIHCSSSKVQSEGIEHKQIEASVANNQNKNLYQEINYVLVQPSYEIKKDKDLWKKLDDKFIFYCRKLEPELFANNNLDLSQEAEYDREIKKEEFQTDQDKIYLLAYFFNPLRKNLVIEQEKQVKEKNLKIRFFLQLQKIWARFSEQYAACTILTTIKNLNYISKILNNIYTLLYYDQQREKKMTHQFDKENPIEILEDMMVNVYVQSFYFSSNQSFLRLNSMRVTFHLELFNDDASIVQSEIHYKRNSASLMNSNDNYLIQFKNRPTYINKRYEQNSVGEGESIMKCAGIVLNFNKVTVVEVKLINIKKKSQNELIFSIDNISISINGNNKGMLLMMPDKDKGKWNRSIVALKVNLNFLNSQPDFDIQIDSIRIQLSQQTVKDLLIAINSFYLINIQEQVALEKQLRQIIFKAELYSKQKDTIPYDIYKKPMFDIEKKESKQKKDLNYTLKMQMESLTIILFEKEVNFFSLLFQQIKIEQKRGQELQVKIQDIQLEPKDDKLQLLDQNNLIQSCQQGSNVTFKIEGRVIYIENMKFILISKYMNELQSFQKKIEAILQESREELYKLQQSEASAQLRIDECEMEIRDNKPIKLILRNSQINVPAHSQSTDYIEFYFTNCEIQIEKAKQEIQLPCLKEEYHQIENKVIDYQEQFQHSIIYLNKISIDLKNLQSFYYFQQDQQQQQKQNQKQNLKLFFTSNSTEIKMSSPYHHASKSNWHLKDQVNVQLSEFKMNLDFGKLLLLKQNIDQNLKEKSNLFNFEAEGLEKINLNISLDNLKVDQQRYIPTREKPKLKTQNTQFLGRQSKKEDYIKFDDQTLY